MDDIIRSVAHVREIERLEQSGIPHPNNVPVFSIEAGGAGNCYYYSTFEALREAGLLEEVVQCLHVSPDKEEFHIQFRNLVADNSNEDIHTLITNICHDMNTALLHAAITAPNEPNVYTALTLPTLRQSYEMRQAALPAARLRVVAWAAANPELNALTVVPDYLNGFSHTFQQILGNLTIGNCHGNSDSIKQQLTQAIRTPGVYVANIEVNIVRRLLLRCNIYSGVTNHNVKQLAKFRNRIVLRNLGEGHYQWFSFREDLFSDVREQKAKESEDTLALLAKYAEENAEARGRAGKARGALARVAAHNMLVPHLTRPLTKPKVGYNANIEEAIRRSRVTVQPTKPATKLATKPATKLATKPATKLATTPATKSEINMEELLMLMEDTKIGHVPSAPAKVAPAPRQERYNANMEEALRRSLANQGVDARRQHQAGISPLVAAAERAIAQRRAETNAAATRASTTRASATRASASKASATKATKKGGNRKSRRRAKSSKRSTRRRR